MPDSAATHAFHQLVDAVAGPDPLPAGGAAAVATLAMGVALGTKVLHFTRDAPPDLRATGEDLRALLDSLRPEFQADCSAFEDLLAAFRRPRDDGQRAGEIASAWRAATAAPVRVAVFARRGEALLSGCRGRVNPNLAGDLTAALELVAAGRRIAESNARENARHLTPAVARDVLGPLADALA